MPELPEVETMRRGLLPAVGSRIVAVHFPRCRYKPLAVSPARPQFRRRLVGRCIECVQRWGKRVVLVLDDATRLIIQPKMTGAVLLTAPPDATHVRLGLQLAGRHSGWLWYWDRRGLGTLAAVSPQQFARLLGPDRLGPDALSVPRTFWQATLGRSRRPIKVALMDQKAVAGIGNLYASEILFCARIHPAERCDQLDGRQWQALDRAVHRVLEQAIVYEGSTLSDGTYRNALAGSGRYQHHHRVYDREGLACRRCRRGRIERIVQAQRSTFLCPRCQGRAKG